MGTLTIVERAVGRTDVGTVAGEGVADSVDRLIIPREIVQMEPVGVSGRDGATAVWEKSWSEKNQNLETILHDKKGAVEFIDAFLFAATAK